MITDFTQALHIGHINSDVLSDLEKLIEGVYYPILTEADLDGAEVWKKDLLNVLQRFSTNIYHISQQLHQEVDFKLPSTIDCNKILAEGSSKVDGSVLIVLKDIAEKWITTIQTLMAQEMKQVPLGFVINHFSIYSQLECISRN